MREAKARKESSCDFINNSRIRVLHKQKSGNCTDSDYIGWCERKLFVLHNWTLKQVSGIFQSVSGCFLIIATGLPLLKLECLFVENVLKFCFPVFICKF